MAYIVDPTTGQLVLVPNTTRAGTMQAQANQPVYGPRNPPPGVSNTTQFGPGAFDVTAPLANALQGIGTGPSSNAPGLRYGIDTTPPATVPAPAAAPVVATVAAPVAAPPVAAPAAPEVAPVLMSDQERAQINSTIATSLANLRPDAPVYQAQERGNYNQYNTDVAKLRRPPENAGINFGFGVNGAPTAQQVLQRYEVQDANDRLRQQDNLRAAERNALDSDLGDAIRSRDPFAIRGARARLELFDRATPSLAPELAANTRASLAAQSARELAGIRSGDVATTAQTELQARLLAAQLTGQYGLAAAQAKGQAAIDKQAAADMSPAGRKASAEAALLETQLNATRAGIAAGELNNNQVIAATRGGQERAAPAAVDPLTGVPYTDEEIAAIQRNRLRQLLQQTATQ